MRTRTVELDINGTKEKIWEILTDFDNIGNWMPGVMDASISDPGSIGVGTKYTINSNSRSGTSTATTDRSYEIISWDKYNKMVSNLTDALGPLKNFQTEWLLKSSRNSTWVSFTARYKMRYGFMGALLDKLILGNFIQKEFGAIVSNLKHFVETGEMNPKQGATRAKPRQGAINQSNDKFSSQTGTPSESNSMFSSKDNTANLQCKKCYGRLNDRGKCDQCDTKW